MVWGLSLTQENKDDLETTLKLFAKMVLKEKYINYENAKIVLILDSLEEQKHILCLKFTNSGIKNNNLNKICICGQRWVASQLKFSDLPLH